MKKFVAMLLAAFMVIGLVGCSAKQKSTEQADEVMPTEEAIQSEPLQDSELFACAEEVFQKIDITIDEKDCAIIGDSETSGVRRVEIETVHEKVNMVFSCFSVDDSWNAVSISNKETKQYYWVDDSTQKYVDIFDWKTGNLLTEKSDEIPDPVENFKRESDKVLEDAKKEFEDAIN